MKSKTKITVIIISQIALIIGSFLIVASLQSEISLIGNSVNIAGKNRFLSSQFVDEVKDYTFVKSPEANPDEKLKQLEENINHIKNGGTVDRITIERLDPKFYEDWIKINENFIGLKTNYIELKNKLNTNLSYTDLIPLEVELASFIKNSDNLVQKLGSDIESRSNYLVILQIILLTVNVLVHIILILIIIGIYQLEFKKNIKLEKLAAIGELSSRLAHDMRNPLSNIQLSLDILKPKLNEKQYSEKLVMMEHSINRLSHQIKDVMDFVRTREPKISLWALNSILEDCLKRLVISDSIKITLPEKNFQIRCDKILFEILFINLFSNSLDSINKKGYIKVDVIESSKEFVITIEDSGPGIPEEFIEKIFDPLVTFKEKGTGLGLASCKNIVEVHGGKISAKNNPTTFRIILPKN